MQGPIEAHVKLCGDCPKWIPGKITYPLGRIGTCGKTGKTTTRTMGCKEVKTVKMKDVDMAVLQSERAAGVSLKDLAEKYGVTDGTICYWLKKARKATEPTASEDFGVVSAAIMESREIVTDEPVQLGPWNAHECGDMPSGVSVIQDAERSE